MIPLERVRAKQQRIYWTDQEWDNLAHIVFKMRLNHLEESITVLVGRAMEQIPPERRRKFISVQSMQPLVRRLHALSEKMQKDAAEVDGYRQRITNYKEVKPEDVLNGLSDEEVVSRFSDRVLGMLTPDEVFSHFSHDQFLATVEDEDLIGLAGRRLASLLRRPPQVVSMPPQPAPAAPKANGTQEAGKTPTPAVVVIGAKGDQCRQISTAVGNHAIIRYVYQQRGCNVTIPTGADLYVVWAKFCSHKTTEQLKSQVSKDKIINHYGGVSQMADLILKRARRIQ